MAKATLGFRGGRRGGIRVLGLVLLVLMATSVASAQDETPTVTPTATYPPGSGDCPRDEPLQTPLAVDYMLRCWQCVPTQTPAVPGIGITPLPTMLIGTPGVDITQTVGTPTVMPTQVYQDIVVKMDGVVREKEVYYDYYWTGSYSAPKNTKVQPHATRVDQRYTVGLKVNNHYYMKDYMGLGRAVKLIINNYSKDRVYVKKDGVLIMTVEYGETSRAWTVPGSNATDVYIDAAFEIEVVKSKGLGDDVDFYFQLTSYSTQTRWETMAWMPGPWIERTPTPTLVPGDCNEYEYQGELVPLVAVPEITITQGSCYVLVPEFLIHFDAVGSLVPEVNIDIRGMSICPKWVDLGTFQILEMDIPVDVMFIPAVIAVLFLIFAL